MNGKAIGSKVLGALVLMAVFGVMPKAEAQCVQNNSGYSAKVRWYKKDSWTYRKATWGVPGTGMTRSFWYVEAAPPVHEANVNNNPGADASTVCHGSGHVVYVTVRGGIYSKIAIWTAVGAAVLGACAAEVATGIPTCELAWELGEMGGKGATSNIPDAKTAIWASEVAPDSDVILRGLTTSVKVLHVKREDFNRKCNASTEGQVCYKDNDDRGTCRKGLCNRN